YNCTAIVGIQVKMTAVRTVANKLAQKPNVGYLTSVAGRYDLIAIVITKTNQELSDFIELEMVTIPGVLRTETYINTNTIKGKWGIIETSELI
ncbi:Lrp/AsnC family transcriptional regulator, partial [Chloroflexota bacterium]